MREDRAGFLFVPFKTEHIFHAAGIAEQIDGLAAQGMIAPFAQLLRVASLGGNVAADIYHAPGLGRQHGLDDCWLHALARRVKNDNVRAQAIRYQLGQQLLHGGHMERGVGDAVSSGVAPRSLDGLGHDFNADNLPLTAEYQWIRFTPFDE